MQAPVPRLPRFPLGGVLVLLLATGCGDGASRTVAAAIERHGGDRFEESHIEFTFRGTPFEVTRDGGMFRYTRSSTDSLGRPVTEVMENDGIWLEVEGTRVEPDPETRARIEGAINSVVYFGFLPFRLDDPPVLLRALGEVEVAGEPYRKVEVTFREEGAGDDWDDRFVYWFHADEHTLDYLAYRYEPDEWGTRFRRAINRREEGGILLQDYENYRGEEPVGDIADYDRLMEEGRVELVSLVELENVEVRPVGDAPAFDQRDRPSTDADEADAPPADEGVELQLGVDRVTYEVGEEIEVALRLINRTTADRTLRFSTGQRYEIVVLDADGEEVSRWSSDRSFLQALGEETLEPGGAASYQESLQAPDAPGAYRLQAFIPAMNTDLTATLPLEVVAP